MSATEPSAKPKVKKAVGPRLRILLYVLFGLLAVLGANSAYLAGITSLEWITGQVYQNQFYFWMFLGHLVLGALVVLPFLVFSVIHMGNTRGRKNRRAVRVGYALFAVAVAILVTGVLLVRVGGFELKQPAVRSLVYWLHVGAPLVALWLYWLHRLVGPKIRWKQGLVFGGAIGAVVAVMIVAHTQDPRQWNVVGPESGAKYFEPSLARTVEGNFIPAKAMMMDHYCKKCHADVHAGWKDSVHRFSSFNNPAYLASVRETREVALKRDGSVQASRWCAGCHDPVPFFSGAFDDPNFDDVNHPTAHAGVTCTVCHSITHVNSNRGNADFTIEEPLHYPFAYSDNEFLQWINNQLVKAKPAFHKKTFLKPLHKTTEFCSTCHKVHLPEAVNDYKFLRGQNHYDSFLLSGVSGHGSRSFYYPPVAQENCNGCHMPLKESDDFGAKLFGTEKLSIHDHLFPSANTGVAWLRDREEVIEAHRKFLEGVMRVDLFAVKEDGRIDGKIHAPLRPEIPLLEPGRQYLLDVVIRTLKMGHHFTQGTVDSNQIWLDVTVKSGGRVIGRNGAMDETGRVDERAHFVNVFMLDGEGNRIDRRNPQDIVVPLYNHQIPPGAGQTVHYALDVPEDIEGPLTVEVKLNYRKFDSTYMDFVTKSAKKGDVPIRGHERGKPYVNRLPVTVLASDRIVLPIKGVAEAVENPAVEFPEWQRWNDYGIGSFLKGKAELRQAAEAFRKVEELGRYDGPLNLARVYERQGLFEQAIDAANRAREHDDPPAPPWTLAWLSGVINRQQGNFKEAEKNFRNVLESHTEQMQKRKFDFSKDYVVLNLLGLTLYDLGNRQREEEHKEIRDAYYRQAVETFEKTLAIDSENVTAHNNLHKLYVALGDEKRAEKHRLLHERYKPDDTARGQAIRLAREKYPAANKASADVVIYRLFGDDDDRSAE